MSSGEYSQDGEEPLSDAAEDVDELREKQRVAIQEMNFEYASELQLRISALTERQGDDSLRVFQTELQKICSGCARRYTRDRKKLITDFHAREIEVRRAVTDEFVERQRVHKRQIRDLEDALFNQFKERMNKPIPQFDEMSQRARQSALRGEFKSAQELRDDAREVQTEELERRRVQFEANYKIQINGLLDRQRQELADLTDRMNKGIEAVEKQRKAAVEQEVFGFRRKLAKEYQAMVNKVRVKKYDPRKNGDQDSDAASVSAEMRPIILKDLAATYDELLKRFGVGKLGDEPKPLPISRAPSNSPSQVSSAASSVFRGKR